MEMYMCVCGWFGDSPTLTPEIDAPTRYPTYELSCPRCRRDVEEMPTCGGCGEYVRKVDDDDLCEQCAEQARTCDACDGTGIATSGPVEGRCSRCHGLGEIRKPSEQED